MGGGGTHGKGGSRYNPGFNYDTSGQYYNMLTKSEQGVEEPSSRVLEAPIQELLRQEEEDNDPCHQRKCTSNEHCCDGHVCVDTQNSVTGSCLPVFGKKEGEICYRDTDCETGFLCGGGLERKNGVPASGPWSRQVWRGMSVFKRVQHSLGTLLPTSTSPKNAAKKAVHLLHRPRGLHRASCFCSEQAGYAAHCWREADERSPRPQLSEIQEINARLRLCPGGGPADTYHNSNQPFPAARCSSYYHLNQILTHLVNGLEKSCAAPILHKISNL